MDRVDFARLFDASPNPYMVIDREFRYVAANRAYVAITGSTLEDLVGRYVFERFPNESDDPINEPRRLLEASFQKVLRTRAPDVLAHIPYRVARSAGEPPELRIWSATHTPLLDERGEVEFILQHTQDVTALQGGSADAAEVLSRAAHVQRDKDELHEQTTALRALLHQAPGFLGFLRGPNHVFEFLNPAYVRLIGGRDVVGLPVVEALPDVAEQGYVDLLDRVYATGEPFVGHGMRVEIVDSHLGGEAVDSYVDFIYQPISAANGERLGVLVQGHEVTDQTRANLRQQFLTRAGEALAKQPDDIDISLVEVAWSAVETIADFAVVDVFEEKSSRRIVLAHANDKYRSTCAALLAFPFPAKPPEGHIAYGLTDTPVLRAPFTRAMIERTAQSPEHAALLERLDIGSAMHLPLFHRDRHYGVLTLATVHNRRMFDEKDLPAMSELGRMTATALDNERLAREREESLRREHDARERAEAASRAKDDFLAMLGHELRNPLAPILIAAQILRMRAHENDDRELSIIERQTQHLVRLVDDLLDVSRISNGKVELRSAPVEIARVARKAVEIVAGRMNEKNQHLVVEIPEEGMVVDADEARITQVLSNLLSNAARYTPPGGHIWLEAEREGNEIAIHVRDDGVGIAAELLPSMFDMFVQAPQAADRSSGGLGLGLTLVRELVELHGGRVAAASPGIDLGSTLTVWLPSRVDATTADLPLVEEQAAVARSRRVLVVDDNVDAAELLGVYLSAQGLDVTVLHDGGQALEAILADPPEAAVIDIGLPTVNGNEIATRVHEVLGARAPRMIALTGYGTEADRDRSRKAGFEEHLTKPAHPRDVLALLDVDG